MNLIIPKPRIYLPDRVKAELEEEAKVRDMTQQVIAERVAANTINRSARRATKKRSRRKGKGYTKSVKRCR